MDEVFVDDLTSYQLAEIKLVSFTKEEYSVFKKSKRAYEKELPKLFIASLFYLVRIFASNYLGDEHLSYIYYCPSKKK